MMKVRPKAIDCIFIDYAHYSSAYHFLVHESNILDIHKNTIMESRNASFSKMYFHVNSRRSQVHQNVS